MCVRRTGGPANRTIVSRARQAAAEAFGYLART